ncbi:MAG: hypothetical protein ABWX73_00365, partial [Marmoricola sp.]
MFQSSSHDFDRLLATGATWLLLGCGGWAVAICTAALVETVTGGRLHATTWVGCPPSLRRALLAALGVALAGLPTVTGAANAATRAGDGPSVTRATREPLPAPARPLGRAPTGSSRVEV